MIFVAVAVVDQCTQNREVAYSNRTIAISRLKADL